MSACATGSGGCRSPPCAGGFADNRDWLDDPSRVRARPTDIRVQREPLPAQRSDGRAFRGRFPVLEACALARGAAVFQRCSMFPDHRRRQVLRSLPDDPGGGAGGSLITGWTAHSVVSSGRRHPDASARSSASINREPQRMSTGRRDWQSRSTATCSTGTPCMDTEHLRLPILLVRQATSTCRVIACASALTRAYLPAAG